MLYISLMCTKIQVLNQQLTIMSQYSGLICLWESVLSPFNDLVKRLIFKGLIVNVMIIRPSLITSGSTILNLLTQSLCLSRSCQFRACSASLLTRLPAVLWNSAHTASHTPPSCPLCPCTSKRKDIPTTHLPAHSGYQLVWLVTLMCFNSRNWQATLMNLITRAVWVGHFWL